MTTTDPNEPRVTLPHPSPNARLVELAAHLTPGDALELGCRSAGDALWLAQRGWSVTAIDISTTAVDQLTELAREPAWSLGSVRPGGTSTTDYLPTSVISSTPTTCTGPTWTEPPSSGLQRAPCAPEVTC